MHIASLLHGIEKSSRREAQYLLCAILDVDRAYLIAYSDQPLSDEQLNRFKQLWKRRCRGEPLAYLIGHKPFFNLQLQVNAFTLIPRPETEMLVMKVLDCLRHDKDCFIADLGTGSGAIACSLANTCPNWEIVATDYYQSTLEVAKKNAMTYGLSNIIFLLGYWYQAFSEISPTPKFDAIVSNPPYIACDDAHLSKNGLAFEPYHALASPCQGLQDLRVIIEQAPLFLNTDGYLMVEHGYEQGEVVNRLFRQAGFLGIHTLCDLAKHPRMTYGQKSI